MKVMASLAIRAAYAELVPAFQRQSRQKVETEWVGMGDIRKRMLAGEVTDVVIGAATLIDDLVNAGCLDSRSRIALAKAEIGAAVRAGARKPDIGSVEAFKSALLGAHSIVYSSGPSGIYLAELFQRLGIAEALKGKAVQAPPGVLVGEFVAAGKVELCFQQIPELRQVKGIDYAGRLPREIQLATVFSGAVHSKSSLSPVGNDLLRHLSSRDAQRVLRKHGLDPA